MAHYSLGRNHGQFVAVCYEDGKRRRLSIGSPSDKATALRLIAELEAAHVKRRREAGQDVAALFAVYLADRERDGRDTGRMRSAWKALAPAWAPLPASAITKQHSLDYVRARRASDVSDGGIRTEMAYLSAALQHAYELELIVRKPMIYMPSPGRPRERWLTEDEASRLIAGTIEPHARVAIMLLLATACRPSHLLQLTWARVDRIAGTIMYDDPERDRTKKGRATVPINDMAGEALDVATALHQGSGYVIEWNGQPIKSLKRAIGEAARRAKLAEVTPYVLRHTAAVWMVSKGVPIHMVSQYMGHETSSITERVYARFAPNHLRQAADALNLRPNASAQSTQGSGEIAGAGTNVPRQIGG